MTDQPAITFTCPSGDGSLRHPCPAHANECTAQTTATQEKGMPDRMAIRMLVAAGYVAESKANEALNIAHGFQCGELEAAPAPAAQEIDLREPMRNLYRAYVQLLESGRDRILSLGGDCDPVDVMEASDPDLRAARKALDASPKGGSDAVTINAAWLRRMEDFIGPCALQYMRREFKEAMQATSAEVGE